MKSVLKNNRVKKMIKNCVKNNRVKNKRPYYITNIILDINECAEGIDNCSNNGNCTNQAGSFSCACNSGFIGNGVSCPG